MVVEMCICFYPINCATEFCCLAVDCDSTHYIIDDVNSAGNDLIIFNS